MLVSCPGFREGLPQAAPWPHPGMPTRSRKLRDSFFEQVAPQKSVKSVPWFPKKKVMPLMTDSRRHRRSIALLACIRLAGRRCPDVRP